MASEENLWKEIIKERTVFNYFFSNIKSKKKPFTARPSSILSRTKNGKTVIYLSVIKKSGQVIQHFSSFLHCFNFLDDINPLREI